MSPQPRTTRRGDKDKDREVRPWVKPGGTLGYARDLKKARKWPPKDRDRKPPKRDREHPVATAYLVVPFGPADLGARPVADARVQYSAGVRILASGGTLVDQPVAGDTYAIEATVDNRGVAPAYLGLADFYAAPAADVDAAAAGGPAPPALGHTGFIVNPASSTIVRCPRPWSPQTADEARATIVVQAYDPTSDMLVAPFDAHADRHVGRRDPVADFAGVWDGTITTSWGTSTYLQRLIITQTGMTITMGYYGQVGGVLPTNPQWSDSGAVSGNQATGFTSENLGGSPFTTNAWTLTLTGPNALDFYNHREYVAPGDTRGTQIETGTLTR
jgi:hypothetical protein